MYFTGTTSGWPYLLLINAGPALISLFLLAFVADSPRYLMIVKKDRAGAERGTSIDNNVQWWIQDFPYGATRSDEATFFWKISMYKRKNLDA